MARYAIDRRPPRTLTEAEQAALLRVTGEHARGFRDHVLFSLALATGLRESELLALDVGDVFDAGGRVRRRVTLRVFKRCTNSPMSQEVFVSDRLAYKLKKFASWKRRRGEGLEIAAPLFVSRNGNRLSARRARAAFRLWQERAGFDRIYSFHSLRHTACTNLYRRERDIRIVQRFARHVNIATTTVYAQPSDEDLFQAVQALGC